MERIIFFVNGQHTTQADPSGCLPRGSGKTVRDFAKKNFDAPDIRGGLVAAISVKVQEPVFESQTKTKLGSLTVAPEGESIRLFVGNFLKEKLDNFSQKPQTADAMLENPTERARTERAGIQKIARERAKKSKVHNRNFVIVGSI